MKGKLVLSVLGIVMSLAVFTIAPAFGADYQELVARGNEMLAAKDYDGAEKTFMAAHEMDASGYEAVLNLGVTYARMGETKKAESYLKQALMKRPDDPVANLELGKLYEDMDVDDEAIDFYELVIEVAPRTEYADQALKLLNDIRKKERVTKRWAAGVSLGVQYDSNVIMTADDTPLPEGISDESDWRGITILGVTYDFYNQDKVKAQLGYSLYQSIHSDLDDYDVRAHSPRLTLTWKARDGIVVKGAYGYDHVTMGDDEYSQTHKGILSLIVAEGKGYATLGEYAFGYASYDDSERFTANSDRDGYSHTVSLTQLIPLAEGIKLLPGAGANRTTAEVEHQEYYSYKASLALSAALPWKVACTLSAEFQAKDYDEAEADSGDEAREEDMQTYSLSLTRPVLPWLSATLSQLFMINDSNIEAYEFDRSVTSAVLTARF